MAFDGIVLNSVVFEFKSKLTGARIDKIYQPEKDEIVIFLRNNKENYKLFLSADSNYPRVHLTDTTYSNPQTPPLFCMLMRKHIGSGKIASFEQVNSDRILKIGIEAYNELGDYCTKFIIIEIMGKHSNIILVDEKNLIIDSIKHIDFTVSSKRQVLPGLFYELPPQQEKLNFMDFDESELKDKLLKKEDILADKFMMNTFSGISPLISREVCYSAFNGLNVIITKDEIDKKAEFFKVIIEFLKEIKNNIFSPNILYEKNTNIPKYFSSIKINQYSGLYNREDFSSPGKMLDNFYEKLHFSRKMALRSHELSKTINNLIEKVLKKISIHEETLLNSKDMDNLKLYGELLTANIYLLKGNESSIRVKNYYNNEDVFIPLDKNLNPAQNIQKYYKEFKKAKTARDMAAKQLKAAKEELYYLEGELSFLMNAKSKEDIDDIYEELSNEGYLRKKTVKTKKNKKADYLKIISSEGYEILVGKNSVQNDEITFKLSKGNDLWFHVKSYPGSHVVVKSKGEEIPEKTIMEAAEYAASYSKDSGNKVIIDYTLIKYVKKPPGAKPGMVNYTNYKSIVVTKKGAFLTLC